MIRKSQLHKLLGAALFAAAAAAAPAHAGVITFDNGYGPVGGMDSSNPDSWTYDAYREAGYGIGFYSNVVGGEGSSVGMFVDGSDFTCDSGMACPPNKTGTYYAALNDSYMDIMYEAGAGFMLKSFDASFVGGNPSLASYPNPPGLIRVIGYRADGVSLSQDYWLNGPTASGFQLSHFDAAGDFANTVFVEALVFGYACDTSGNCKAFQTDKGQFAIDNIAMTDVPEPATAAIVGLGLLGLGAARRRRKA